jgi:hypothetical protein
MIGLGTLSKLVRAGMGKDELEEVLSTMLGGDVTITPIQESSVERVAEALGDWVEGSRSSVIRGTTRAGDRVVAILVFQPPEIKTSVN